MKKSFSISLIFLAFVLLGSAGCDSWKNLLKFKSKEPEPQIKLQPQKGEKYYWTEDQEPISIPPIISVSPPKTGMPPSMQDDIAFLEPKLVAFSGNDKRIVSLTYPKPECGIVQLDKTIPMEVVLNNPFDYTIKITNLTDAVLTGIVINEELSDNFDFESANPVPQEDLKKLTWEIKSLGPKASRQFTVSGISTGSDSLENCTTVDIPVLPACTPIRIVQPRLELTRNIPAEALLCEPIPVSYVVTNTGTGSAQDVKIVDKLPSGLRTTSGRSHLEFNVGTLAEGQSTQYSIEIRADKVGNYTGKAIATSSTCMTSESQETATIVGLPSLAIVNNGPKLQYIGRPIAHEITVTNNSNVPAKNTVIEDNIPQGSTSIEASEGAKFSGTKLIWELGTLDPGDSKTVQISYLPNRAGTLTNDATATAYCSESVSSSVKTLVTGISALSMEVVDVDDPVRINNRATYVISVTNQGSAAATNINIACILEDNVQYVSSAGATPGSTEGRMVRFHPLRTLAPKAKAVWRVAVTAVKPGDVRFKAIMNADELDRPVEETESTHLYE